MNKGELGNLIDYTYRVAGEKETVLLADRVKNLGYRYATKAGISMCIDNMLIPPNKEKFLEEANREVEEVRKQYTDGLITDGERYNKVIDIWSQVTEKIADEMLRKLGTEEVTTGGGKKIRVSSMNPIFMMADSGARGSAQQIRQLAGMRGLMAKPSGEIIETPITANFREGLTVLQYFISTHGARKGLADTALKTANSGYLTRRLVDVAQDVIISEYDCETLDGIEATALVEGGEIIEPLTDRILGRVALEDVKDPYTGEVLVKGNEEIDEQATIRMADAGLDRAKIRSVLTCKSKRGVCALCYGRDLARGRLVNVGEAIGIIAAQSIGEPGTQLTMRTFHIGGTASRRAEQTTLKARIPGKVKFENLKTVKNRDGDFVVMNRNGEIAIIDEEDRERRRHSVIYGAKVKVQDGDEIKEGQFLAEWDPYSIPILTEVPGVVKFGDIIEGVTMQEKVDDFTGLSRKVIMESKDPQLRPRISIKDESGKTLTLPDTSSVARYLLSVGSNILVTEGDAVKAGDVFVKIPRETTKTKDITGGLPRVAELFEARKPKEFAIISEINGTVSFGRDVKGKRKVIITPDVGEPREYSFPRDKHISVHEGDSVKAGEPLMDGPANPHDILRVLGDKELAKYLVDEIQEVYKLQGVKINDKHIEVIVRQMLKRVQVKEVGDTKFLVDDQVEKNAFEEENARVLAQGGKPAIAEPLFLGITKASLITDSFISAASFQETTKVLTQAAVSGKTDYLRGLKENVIMGRLIPAGTGFNKYRDLIIHVEGYEEEEPRDMYGENEELQLAQSQGDLS
jgi:DNA-directed RNA polymerase subunit beta'